MKLNQIKIGPRLGLGFGIVVLLMASLVLLMVLRLSHLSTDNAEIVELQRRAAAAAQWRADVHLNAARALAIAKAGGAREVADYFAPQMKETTERISAVQKSLTEWIDTDQGKELLASISAQRVVYRDARQGVLDQIKAGDLAAAQASLDNKMAPAAINYVAAIDALVKFQSQRVDNSTAKLAADVRSAQWLLVAALGAAALLACGLGWAITRSITLPLRQTVAATNQIAGGDLTGQISFEGRDETADVQSALLRMREAMRKLVGEVRAGSDSIGTASAQIASGNQDLSSRTEQTSSSLQQAASSLEELTGTVGQTADSARTANQLAASASQAAERGGVVVSQVVSTMEDINASSRRIADIIGTIDGIAFQTNILALNAAVEAARAGEQGRGFAVVAGEVRSLAQRSAEAAREIKTLIQASVEKVETGTRLVQDAGAAMGDIVGGVQRVTDVIGEISAATSEQSSGLRQVNEAVAGLDQMTQQNAALVEESAAAAESLAEQSRKLSGVVSSFRLAPQFDKAMPAPRPPAAKPAAPLASQGTPTSPKALASRALALAKQPAAGGHTLATASAVATSSTAGAAPAPAPARTPARAAAPAPAPSPAPAAGADGDWETF